MNKTKYRSVNNWCDNDKKRAEDNRGVCPCYFLDDCVRMYSRKYNVRVKMVSLHKSSSHVQLQAEEIVFQKVVELLKIPFEKNKKIYLADNAFTYMQPDFYSEEHGIVGEIFVHIGKPKKAQDNKIANDILKMLLLEKVMGKQYRKIIVVCDAEEYKKLKGQSLLAESIRQFDIVIQYIEIEADVKRRIVEAQEIQKMVNS